jgi:hypothetical protein
VTERLDEWLFSTEPGEKEGVILAMPPIEIRD